MVIIGVAGGSGSGKTTFARALAESLGRDYVAVLAQDSYYFDQSGNFDRDGGRVNFDDPSAIDWRLLEQHLKLLRAGAAVDVPVYDFATHKRAAHARRVEPKPYIIVDGILIYVDEHVRSQINYKVFIDVPEALRFDRRLKRDVAERGRTPDGVRAQFFGQVKPMHDRYVEPARQFADMNVNGDADFSGEVERVMKKCTSMAAGT